jgi:hypothetical protein
MKEFSTAYALLAAFLVYRKHRLLRTELDDKGKPQFVFEDDERIPASEKAFRDDCAAPVLTVARIFNPLRRQADSLRNKFREQQKRRTQNGTLTTAARSSHQTPAVV